MKKSLTLSGALCSMPWSLNCQSTAMAYTHVFCERRVGYMKRNVLLFVVAVLGSALAWPVAQVCAQTKEKGPWWPHPLWGAVDQAGGSNLFSLLSALRGPPGPRPGLWRFGKHLLCREQS
jgi:hypothetical protein